MTLRLWFSTLLGCLLLGAVPAIAKESAPGDELDMALIVEEPAGVDRTGAPAGEMVRSGVPLSRSAGVLSAERLYLLRRDDMGEWTVEVPVQARITSRWGGTADREDLPAKWVLLDFPVSIRANRRMELRLRYDRDGSRGTWQSRLPENTRLVTEEAEVFRVDTGRLRFGVEKGRFGAFVGLSSLDTRGEEPEWVSLCEGNPLEVRLVDGKGVEYRASALAPYEVLLEEDGPLASVLVVRGRFADGDGRLLLDGWLGYTLRIHVYAQSAFVRVFFTLENNGFYGLDADWSVKDNYPKWLYFDRLSLTLAGDFGEERSVSAGGLDAVLMPDGPDAIRLFQGHRIESVPETLDDESRNFFYRVDVAGSDRARSGSRSRGVMSVDDGARSVAVGVRHFWQNYPKALGFRGKTLSVELWPAEGFWPDNRAGRAAGTYQFEGGRHKTYEMGFDFSPGGAGDPTEFAKRLGRPLFARPEPAAAVSTGALGLAAPPGFPVGNAAIEFAMRRFERMHEAYVDAGRAEPQPLDPEHRPRVPAISLVTQRETRGNALKAQPYDVDLYGWFSFGDLPRAGGFSSLHYDWPLGMFLQYLRHDGKREFLDLGEEMVRHRYDIDQYHNREDEHANWMYFNGFARCDSGWHGDLERGGEAARSERPPRPGATWLGGLLLHHALTGDRRSLEAARENADAFLHYFELALRLSEEKVPLRRSYEVRTAAMGVLNLLDFYAFTGEEQYRRMAETVYANQIRYTEELLGNHGFFEAGGEQNLFDLVLLLEPLRKLHRVTGDPEVLALLVRICGRLKSIYLETSGYTQLERYKPLQIPMLWVPGRFAGSQIPYGYYTADAFAYLWLETGEAGFLEFARRLFYDSVIYFQAGEAKLVPPEFLSPVSYSPAKYPGSETQVDAWVLRGHQVYLFAEWMAGRENAAAFRFPYDDFRRSAGAEVDAEAEVAVDVEVGGAAESEADAPLAISVTDIVETEGLVSIHVTTDRPATVRIEIGRDTVKTRFSERTSTGTMHRINLTDLASNRPYYFRVHAYSSDGRTAVTPFRPLRSALDLEPPAVRLVSAPDERTVRIEFTEPLSPETALRKDSYLLDGGVTVLDAALDETGTLVTLSTDPLTPGKRYEVRLTGLLDLSTPPNPVMSPEGGAGHAFYRDIVADDSGPAFEIVAGDWGRSTTDLLAFDRTVRFARRDGPVATARWRLPVPADGYYEVYARWPAAPLEREVARIAPYRIHHRGGVNQARVNQRARAGGWVRIATLPFEKARGAVIELTTDGADGTVLADAIRLVYTEL